MDTTKNGTLKPPRRCEIFALVSLSFIARIAVHYSIRPMSLAPGARLMPQGQDSWSGPHQHALTCEMSACPPLVRLAGLPSGKIGCCRLIVGRFYAILSHSKTLRAIEHETHDAQHRDHTVECRLVAGPCDALCASLAVLPLRRFR